MRFEAFRLEAQASKQASSLAFHFFQGKPFVRFFAKEPIPHYAFIFETERSFYSIVEGFSTERTIVEKENSKQ